MLPEIFSCTHFWVISRESHGVWVLLMSRKIRAKLCSPLQMNFLDVFAEPDSSLHSVECVWSSSYKVSSSLHQKSFSWILSVFCHWASSLHTHSLLLVQHPTYLGDFSTATTDQSFQARNNFCCYFFANLFRIGNCVFSHFMVSVSTFMQKTAFCYLFRILTNRIM